MGQRSLGTGMTLGTMDPDPDWDPAAHEDALAAVGTVAEDLVVRIWCGDWCGDCRRLLPPFAAALAELALPESAIRVYAVEKRPNGSKVGDRVEDFQVDRTPTVVLELDGDEVARFEEGRTDGPILEALADQLAGLEIESGQS